MVSIQVKLKLCSIVAWNMIRYNLVKVIGIISLLFSIWVAKTTDSDITEYQSVSCPIFIGEDTVLVGQLIGKKDASYEAMEYKSNGSISIENFNDMGIIQVREMNDFIFWWLIMSIIFMLAVTLSCLISNDWDDPKPGWEYDLNLRRAKSKFIDCEKEGEIFYYTVFDRLVCESNHILSKDNIIQLDWSFNELNYCPKFKTKRNWRQSSLKELGV